MQCECIPSQVSLSMSEHSRSVHFFQSSLIDLNHVGGFQEKWIAHTYLFLGIWHLRAITCLLFKPPFSNFLWFCIRSQVVFTGLVFFTVAAIHYHSSSYKWNDAVMMGHVSLWGSSFAHLRIASLSFGWADFASFPGHQVKCEPQGWLAALPKDWELTQYMASRIVGILKWAFNCSYTGRVNATLSDPFWECSR